MAFQTSGSLLDACVLAVLVHGDAYGYVLTQSIKSVIPLSESALYPVLKRLEKAEQLRVYDSPFGGRMRRYYAITELGAKTLDTYKQEWNEYKKMVDDLFSERTKGNE